MRAPAVKRAEVSRKCHLEHFKMESDRKTCFDPTNNENKNIESCNETLESFTSVGFKMLVEATKKSNTLPSGKARDLYESYPSFHNVVEKQGDYVLSILSKMMKYTNCRGCISKKDDEEKFEMIVDSNDSLLENVGISLDKLSGVIQNPNAKFLTNKLEFVNGSWNKNKKIRDKAAAQVLNKLLNQSKNIEKPQLKFKNKINNDSDTPFEPTINYKYNMLKPLSFILEKSENGVSQFTHPYEFELEKFKPSQEQMKHHPPILYKSLRETPLVLVNTPEDVAQLVNDLENCKEVAVDLEHHSYRSFQGFTCLMQISTREKDYIIDALALRSDLEILNKIFTNPSVVKVFHGADSDIQWLQRDLSLYVVNMFDTHQAAKLLNFPKLSLGYLLSYYCNVDAQKQFQLADWRIRPLPQELLTYAREDTHYLLFIYDNLRNSLIEKANYQTNLLESVISESTRICLKRYVKPVYETDGYLDLYHRSKKLFDNRQKFALQELFKWRDSVARDLDESYAYVLPDHMMLNISEVLPREAQGILACCNPVPVPVRQNFIVLHQIILKAREQPLLKPILEEERLHRYTTSVNPSENPLQCPHDLNQEEEFRDDLPVLFNGSKANLGKVKNFHVTFNCSKPIINVFESSLDVSEKAKLQLVEKRIIHLTPYHRYKLSKKFSESIEVKSLNKNDTCDMKKEQESSSFVKEEQGIQLEKSFDALVEKSEKDAAELMPTDRSGNKTYSHSKEQTVQTNKRKVEYKTSNTKKAKGESGDPVMVHPGTNVEKKVETEIQKQKKKTRRLHKKKSEFQSFNYNSVDFKQYESSEIIHNKRVPKKCKQNKKSGKKLKISI